MGEDGIWPMLVVVITCEGSATDIDPVLDRYM